MSSVAWWCNGFFLYINYDVIDNVDNKCLRYMTNVTYNFCALFSYLFLHYPRVPGTNIIPFECVHGRSVGRQYYGQADLLDSYSSLQRSA